jgi:dihydrofolate reductase
MPLKCSVFIASSLDGYIARSDGGIDWLTGAAESNEDYGYQAFFNSIDSLVIGRKTYETALAFDTWPYKGKKVFVFTADLKSVSNNLTHNVLAVSPPASGVVEKVVALGCRHAYIDGGRTIQTFLAEGCIGEMTITTIPILIGDGIRLFGKLNGDVKLKHLETKTYANGFVQTRYAPSRVA